MAHTIDETAILDRWDNGEVVATFTDDETIEAIAKALKLKPDEVRAVLVAAGRVEGA